MYVLADIIHAKKSEQKKQKKSFFFISQIMELED